jgi:(1->4)-alpha-D-glucan 1-alpha-D-glucosylmutase
MRRAYVRLTGKTEPFADVVYTCKRLIMDTAMSSELNVLAHMLNRISENNRRSRDFTLDSLRLTITEVVACFPVYRTYVVQRVSAQDRRYIEWALAKARRRSRTADASVFDFIRHVLLLQPPGNVLGASTTIARSMRFRQFTAPVTAKASRIPPSAPSRVAERGGQRSSAVRTTRRAFHRANALHSRNGPTPCSRSLDSRPRSADVRARST